MIHKVRGRLKESCVQFPRLYYLSDKDILKLLSSNGSPISIVPLISRVFPAIKGMQLTEVIPNQSSTTFRKLASKSEEGNSLMPRCMYVYVHMTVQCTLCIHIAIRTSSTSNLHRTALYILYYYFVYSITKTFPNTILYQIPSLSVRTQGSRWC